VKLVEIARLAGVSKATVSYALSGKGNISPETRTRVREIAERFGYEPHGPATALSLGAAHLVGIVPRLPHPLSIQFQESASISGLAKGMSGEGYEFVLLKEEARSGVPRMLAQRAVCAAAFLRVPSQAVRDWVNSNPVVCVAVNIGPVTEMDSVYPDDEGGVRLAVEHLATLGHKRIAYVNSHGPLEEDHVPSLVDRGNAFLKAVAELGLHACAGSEQRCDVAERVEALLGDNPPTAYLCYTDDVAAVVVQYLSERGMHVPEDASVIGINDAYAASIMSPPTTSVHVPHFEIGERAATLLLERMRAPSRPIEHVKLAETLVARKSTCRPRGDSQVTC